MQERLPALKHSRWSQKEQRDTPGEDLQGSGGVGPPPSGPRGPGQEGQESANATVMSPTITPARTMTAASESGAANADMVMTAEKAPATTFAVREVSAYKPTPGEAAPEAVPGGEEREP